MSRRLVLRAPRSVAVEPERSPVPGPGQVLLRTLHSGISAGTELAAYRGTSPTLHRRWDGSARLFRDVEGPPRPYPVRDLGYEEVGEVVALGPEVDGAAAPAPGDRVFGTWGHRTHHVMDAAEALERRLPDGLPALAGIFSHIGSTALNGVHDAGARIGETVVVFGLGVPGQIAARLLRASGVRTIGVEPLASRRALAGGALDVALSPGDGPVAERVRDLTDGRGADAVVEASGAVPALHEAIRSVAYASRVVALGFYQGGAAALALGEEFHHNRVELISSQISGVAPDRAHRWDRRRLARELMRLQARGVLDLLPLVTHRIPFDDAPRAFELVDERPEETLQVVLDLHGEEGDPA